MALSPFIRPPRQGSAFVLARMEAKRRVYAARRSALKRQVEKADREISRLRPQRDADQRVQAIEQVRQGCIAEDKRIASFEADLEVAYRAELDEVSARSSIPKAVGTERPRVQATAAAPPASETLSAGAGFLGGKHDDTLCLFCDVRPTEGDVGRRVVDPAVEWRNDPLMVRALAIVEIPGLVHTLVLAERRQRVVDVGSIVVPQEALGLPTAPAFDRCLFSAQALNHLRDPVRAPRFLSEVASVGRRSGRP